MIYYNLNTINDWNFGDDNIIKVYKHGAVVFYKFDSEQGGYKVCYAVVDDITQYSDREYEDVYDKATEKWFKLNNLNQYEQYGVYGSGRTSCEGSASRLPQGYTEVGYIENTGTSYLDIAFKPNTNTRIIADMQQVTANDYPRLFGCNNWNATAGMNVDYEGGYLQISWFGKTSWTQITSIPNNFDRHVYDLNKNNLYVDETLVASTTYSSSYQSSDNLGIFMEITGGRPGQANYFTQEAFKGKMYSFKVYDNGTLVRDLVPCIKDSDNTVGAYDIVNDVFYTVPTGYTTDKLIAGGSVTPTDCVTTYNGKLTIDDGYEYEWNGSSWVNLGEVSGSSKTSDFKIGDIKERVTTGVSDGDYLLFSYYRNSDISKPENIMSYNPSNNYLSNLSGYGITSIDSTTIIDPSIWILESTASANTFYIKSIKNNLYWGYQNTQTSRSLNLVDSSSSEKAPVLITPSCKENCYGFVEKKSNVSTGYGGYGLNQLYSYTYQLNWLNNSSSNVPCTFFTTDGNSDFIIYKMNASDAEYPKYYSEKSEPLDDLTFNTLEDAQAYAKANCVYDGMKATIGADRYYFDSTDENGWVKILEYYKFEDVTPGGASGWTISGSSTYNPDSSYYDDFDLETTSTSNVTKIAKVTIYGYDHFTYYLRTTGYSTYCYVVATNVDEVSTPSSTMSYNSASAITNTYYWNKSPKSPVNLSNYRRVTYNNLDKTVEHTFYVYFYGRTYSSYVGNATILIPKEQTNENWEQVTFSASSNVASAQKNLYIDNNYSTSGGTQYWYYRWIVGLPSGSHSSYTTYSIYNYCPNVTSSTFTSVAGEQRQVNFTYDNTTNKTLSFRLTDGSNVLTPSDTIYYNMTYYNSCGVSSGVTNTTFPRSQSVKVGGRFRFANSSNRHYIYGYSPNISLNTDYYVDNYQSTFDITYTKLSDEAVTITYTTYDPSDVETPSFKTDITWPYSGGTTSSTTLASYTVPYTYPYKVSQTSGKFSADSQSYTANQAARAINFVLYPNNREFATVADMEAYQYAWEGMKAYVGDTNYEYKNGEWVEYSGIIWLDPSATNALFSIGHYWGENYKMVITTYLSGSYSGDYGSFWQYNEHTPIEFSFYSNGFYYDFHNPTSTTAPNVNTGDYSWRIMKNGTLSSYENGQILNIILSNGAVRVELESTGAAIVTGSTSVTAQNWYSGLYQANIGLNNANAKCHLSHIQIYNGNNELVNDFKFIKNNGVVGSQEISIYDSVTNTTYNNTNSNTPVYHIEI